MQQCDEEKLLGHLGVVLYEYLGEEYPEVLGSILGALKSIVNVIGMSKMTPPIKDLLPRLTPILKNRHEKVQENCIVSRCQLPPFSLSELQAGNCKGVSHRLQEGKRQLYRQTTEILQIIEQCCSMRASSMPIASLHTTLSDFWPAVNMLLALPAGLGGAHCGPRGGVRPRA